MVRYSFCFIAVVVFVLGRDCACQDVVDLKTGAVGTYLTLKQLRTTGSVLHVVAHPDDEDGAMLAYCARGLGVRTMLFSITRGEGGANRISSHFFDELGALRTLEHLKAASYYGNELFYSRAADYGYSKTLAEAMTQWNNGIPILEDLVEVIRREQPTVLLSRFRGDPRDGHGHHQMAGVLSRLAFDAAADPRQFPQQLERGLHPWQVKKLYVGVRAGRRGGEAAGWTIALPTGTYDPMLGKSYAQIARFGLGFQRSQGVWGHEGDPGPQTSHYRLVKQVGVEHPAESETSLFDSISTTLSGLVPLSHDSEQAAAARKQLAAMDEALTTLWSQWKPGEPLKMVSSLVRQLEALRSLKTDFEAAEAASVRHIQQELLRKQRQLERAIVLALGLQLDCWAVGGDERPIRHASPGQRVKTYVRLANRNSRWPVTVSELVATAPNVVARKQGQGELAPRAIFETEFDIQFQRESAPTRPHWIRSSPAEPFYETSGELRQGPAPAAPYSIEAKLTVDGVLVTMREMVYVRRRHPEFGDVKYALTLAPPVSVRFPLGAGVVPLGKGTYEVTTVVRSAVHGTARGSVALELPSGWTSSPASHSFTFDREDEEATYSFAVQLPPGAAPREYVLHAVASYDGKQYRQGYQTVTARDLERINVYRSAKHRVRIADLQMAGKPRVGYIRGSGDKVAESLAALDIEPQTLSTHDLAVGQLRQYDLILVGVRAYAVREDVRKYNSRLLDYVKQGGVLIIQYQTPEFDHNFGPYPYEMGRRPEEVSQEDATVTVLQPDHPIFNRPNKITAQDFEGWFEQRGSKFWTSWDPRYTALLECHDTGQPPQRGGMLIGRYGKGVYLYSAYAWYRQLPHGVAGAYRLFANMLSLPQTAGG